MRAAVDSALGQDPQPEVVVVDDGSIDNSRQIIASYGREVLPVLKENGGQTSAFNAGFQLASGDAVIFLDADDILLPGAIERVLQELADEGVAKAHWQMRVLGEGGNLHDELIPAEVVSHGDLRAAVVRSGPGVINNPPTSGNAWSRRYLRAIFPLPTGIELCGDAYMGTLAPLYGGGARSRSRFRPTASTAAATSAQALSTLGWPSSEPFTTAAARHSSASAANADCRWTEHIGMKSRGSAQSGTWSKPCSGTFHRAKRSS